MRWMWLTWLLMSATAHAGYQGTVIYSPAPQITACKTQVTTPTQSPVAKAPVVRKHIAKVARLKGGKKPAAVRRVKRVKKPPIVAEPAPAANFCAVAVADQVKKLEAPVYSPMPKAQWQSASGFWPSSPALNVAPEPPTIWLLFPGLLALAIGRRQ